MRRVGERRCRRESAKKNIEEQRMSREGSH